MGQSNTMEEEIYWKCFRTVQFSKTLSAHFHHQLEVPKRFAENLREKLGTKVSLKCPSGAVWKIGLVMERGCLYFNLGWKKFIEDNSLEENDLLIFKYNGSSNFEVSMFDGKSLCEKEASYFVRKCTHTDMKRESRREEKETSENISENVLRGNQSPQPQDEDAAQVEESFHVESASEDDKSMMEWTPWKKSKKAYSARRRATNNRPSHEMKRAGEVRPTKVKFISNRRPVTEEEKSSTERRAHAEASDESLVIVMKDYHVYSRFCLTLPAWWSNYHLPRKHQIVKLQLEGKVWPVNYVKKVSGGMLIAGWKKFVLDNSLEEDDACLFNLVNAESSPIVINVTVFRVVGEVVPPTPLRPTSSSQRGRRSGVKPC